MKLLEQQQSDLAVKTTNVEEALRKGERVLTRQVRPHAIGELTHTHTALNDIMCLLIY